MAGNLCGRKKMGSTAGEKEKKGMKRILALSMAMLAVLLFTGCAGGNGADSHMEGTQQMESSASETPGVDSDDTESAQNEPETDGADRAVLLYQGQASIRIVTAEGRVIYVDPYAGDDYELSADLILVTHPHYDHNMVDKVQNRNPGCEIITQDEAIQNGEHQIFDLGYVTVEAVEAGYNSLHDVSNCVGYILTFSDGKSVYVTGDTSTTEQMPLLAEKNIDYAFFCCDGIYNMGLEEAAECAELVGAKHNIPYHVTAKEGVVFDRELAEQFEAPDRLIVEAGEEIVIE